MPASALVRCSVVRRPLSLPLLLPRSVDGDAGHAVRRAASAPFAGASRSPARWLPALALSALLAACGGGGGGGGGGGSGTAQPSAPPASSPPPTAANGHLVAGISTRSDAGSSGVVNSVLVADAQAAAGTPLLALPVEATTALTLSPAFTADAAARTLTYKGSSQAYFVRGGALMHIDLTQAGTPAARQLSSLSDACWVQQAVPLQADARQAWVVVVAGGADGSCQTGADNVHVLVRTGTAADAPPVRLPLGVTVQPPHLLGDDGALWWMLAVDATASPARLVAYGPTLTRVDVNGGDAITAIDSARTGFNATEGAFVRTGTALRRLGATAGAVTLSPALHAFTHGSGVAAFDSPSLHFNDGSALLTLDGGGTVRTLRAAEAGHDRADLLAQTATGLLVQLRAGAARGALVMVDKASGQAVTVLPAPAADEHRTVWAMRGDTVWYATGRTGAQPELRRVRTDGSDDTRVHTGVQVIGAIASGVNSATRSRLSIDNTALLLCQPLPQRSDCRGSTVLQYGLQTGTLTSLGQLNDSTAASWMVGTAVAVDGVPGAVLEVKAGPNILQPTHAELYTFVPGVAGSLALVRQPTT